MNRGLRIAAHIFLFIVAVLVFYIGLFMGLQVNPNIGTALWIVSAVIVAGNIYWMTRAGRRTS